jgi:hypothetical protein
MKREGPESTPIAAELWVLRLVYGHTPSRSRQFDFPSISMIKPSVMACEPLNSYCKGGKPWENWLFHPLFDPQRDQTL